MAVETQTGRLTAALAVLAAGAWSGSIPFTIDGTPQRLPGSFPVRGHLIGYRLPPGACRTILRQGHTYILQRSNGFTIAGTSMETVGYDRRIDWDVVNQIAGRAEALLPQLRQAGAPEAWIPWLARNSASAACSSALRSFSFSWTMSMFTRSLATRAFPADCS